VVNPKFISDESGAVTVDWVVLSAAVVGLSIATVGVLSNGLEAMVSRIDAELRDQQMSDSFISFTSAHFEPFYARNLATPEQAQAAFGVVNLLMNQEIIDQIGTGIVQLEAGQLTTTQMLTLSAMASVARQRNIIDPTVLDYYFGVDGANGVINNYL
jgi:Flp pilus assembly pilin Flp